MVETNYLDFLKFENDSEILKLTRDGKFFFNSKK